MVENGLSFPEFAVDGTDLLAQEEQVYEFLFREVGKPYDLRINEVLCQGLAKLVYADLLESPHLVSPLTHIRFIFLSTSQAVINLFKVYVAGSTQEWPPLLQFLTLFFPAYARNSAKHQEVLEAVSHLNPPLRGLKKADTLTQVFSEVLRDIAEDRASLRRDGKDESFIAPNKLCGMFVQWTDPDFLVKNDRYVAVCCGRRLTQ